MTDRFSEATAELTENNPYIYASSLKTFGHQTIAHLGGEHDYRDAVNARSAECILNCDPVPFGD